MGQIFLARHLLQKAMVNSPLGGRLRPCIGFRVNPAANTSSAALAHDSRHCSLLIPTCWAAAGLKAGAEAMRLGKALSCWPPHRLGISDCSLYLRYSSIVFFKACLFGFVFFSQEQVGIHLPSGKMQYYKFFRCCPHYRKDGHLRNKYIDLS